MKKRNGNPICPFDKIECTPNLTGFAEMDGYLNCNDCPRYCNGVRATGGMPNLEILCNSLKRLTNKIKNRINN